MKKIKLVSIHYHNFKGIKDYTLIPNGQNVSVFGANATGKTTLFDGFTWLLFGKNSEEQKAFNVKPLDSNKQEILGLEPFVEATILINDRETILKRELSEVWAKPNGQLEKERKPDKTKLYIDEVPKKLKEYQDFIGSIVDEDTFKLLTNPFAFNNLHWTKRREILTEITGDIDNDSVISSDDKLKGLQDVLNGRTVDEQKKVINEQKRKIKADIDGIPSRIDEANRAIPEINGDEGLLKSQVEKGNAKLESLETKKAEMKNSDSIAELKKQRADLELDLQQKKSSFLSGKLLMTQNLQNDLNVQQKSTNELDQQVYKTSQQVVILCDKIERDQKKKAALLAEYKQEASVTFDEHSLICPTCGQDLQESQIDELKNKFNLRKSTNLETLKTEGTKLKDSIAKDSATLTELKAIYDDQLKGSSNSQDTLEQLKDELNQADIRFGVFEDTKEFLDTSIKIEEINTQIQNDIKISEQSWANVDEEMATVKEAITRLNQQLSQFSLVAIQVKRIAELRGEEEKMKAKYLELERQAFLIDEFIRAKIRLLESKINEKFKLVKFNLFDIQKNGAIDETCETTVNGIPYSTDLNNAAKINGGLDIINTLSEFYEVEAPIFIDNAESVNELLEMDAQTIALVVSDDEKLKVV